MNEIDILNPNCSEAVFRIDVSEFKWDKKAQREFDKAVMEALDESELDFYIGEGNLTETHEVNMNEQDIFGKKVLTMNGEMPYNNGDVLVNAVDIINMKLNRKYNCEVTDE